MPQPKQLKMLRPFALVLGLLFLSVVTASAQSPYGGMYYEDEESDYEDDGSAGGEFQPTPTPIPRPTPSPTPTPQGRGKLQLTVDPVLGTIGPGGEVSFQVSMNASGYAPGQYLLKAMNLDPRMGRLAPAQTSLAGSGTWTVHVQAGEELGTYPVYFVAQDLLLNHTADSVLAYVDIVPNDPYLITPTISLIPGSNTDAFKRSHRSWIEQIRFRNFYNPRWFEYLAEDLYASRSWQRTISQATQVDRDRLNITKTMAPLEQFKSYTDLEPIMSRYWADTGIAVSMATANQIGDVMLTWRAKPHLVVQNTPGVGQTLGIKRPVQGIKVGNVLNGVGATMILLDFWANMSNAESPSEIREAWAKAEYASLDLYIGYIVGNTFGSAAALPGMMVSYTLTHSYDTLMTGYRECWYKRLVIQAMDADLLGESIHDTRAVNRVKDAMLSPIGLEKTLLRWWNAEAPTWAAKMGGCGNWDLAEANLYQIKLIERLMHETEVEIDGRRYHPWAFYYSVSRMLVIERRKEMAREAAEQIRLLESAYISTLEQTIYIGSFRLVSQHDPTIPVVNAHVQLTEDPTTGNWITDTEGQVSVQIPGHRFSPDGNALLTVRIGKEDFVFAVPQASFEKVAP